MQSVTQTIEPLVHEIVAREAHARGQIFGEAAAAFETLRVARRGVAQVGLERARERSRCTVELRGESGLELGAELRAPGYRHVLELARIFERSGDIRRHAAARAPEHELGLEYAPSFDAVAAERGE